MPLLCDSRQQRDTGRKCHPWLVMNLACRFLTDRCSPGRPEAFSLGQRAPLSVMQALVQHAVAEVEAALGEVFARGGHGGRVSGVQVPGRPTSRHQESRVSGSTPRPGSCSMTLIVFCTIIGCWRWAGTGRVKTRCGSLVLSMCEVKYVGEWCSGVLHWVPLGP